MFVYIQDDHVKYSECGCKFKIIDRGPPIRIDFDARTENLNLDCPLTWNLIGEGNTKGCFQLESRFGQQYAKKLKPENIEHLAALAAILRPGCINSFLDGKSIAEHYIDRKNGIEPITPYHQALEPILRDTYQLLIFQEGSMKIAHDIAGLNMQDCDSLRKSIGKKIPALMAEMKTKFLEGCNKTGIVTNEEAEEIFGWIEASQRYAFNHSHSVSYAYTSYQHAYCKAHFPVSFFTSNLYYAKDKQKTYDEIKLLVNNARIMGVDIWPPDFRKSGKHFLRIPKEVKQEENTYDPYSDKIYFGLTDIKGIGDRKIDKMQSALYIAEETLGKKRDEWTWTEFLVHLSPSIDSVVAEGLIEAGALSYLKVPRNKMLFEYSAYQELTAKEQAWFKQQIKKDLTLREILEFGLSYHEEKKEVKGPCHNKNRVAKVKELLDRVIKPPYSLEDQPTWIARVEEARLGVSLTATVLDSCKNADQANCTIPDFIKRQEPNSGIFIACQIESVKTHIASNGEEMAFVSIDDGEATLDCVIFSDTWKSLCSQNLCVEGNTVLVTGERSRQDSLIIKKIWQLT